MRHPIRLLFVVGVVASAPLVGGGALSECAAAAEATAQAAAVGPVAAPVAPPLVFEGFGLADFKGAGSMASALAGIGGETQREDVLGMPVDLVVKGPSGRDRFTDPLNAELRSRIEGLDLSAGMQADPAAVHDGPAKWIGGVRVSSQHAAGREILELRTSLDRRQQDGLVKLELGPRIERKLRNGTMLFIDGKAQAQARRSADGGVWTLPGLADGQAGGSVGVNASTGLVR
jgi:hypothetical protein